MNSVLKNFKTIPCPAGDKCAQSDCQWMHPWDKGPVLEGGCDGAADSPSPRKRLKLDRDDETPADPDDTKKTAPAAAPSSSFSSAASSSSSSLCPPSPPEAPLPLASSKRCTPTVTHNEAPSKDSPASASPGTSIHPSTPQGAPTPSPPAVTSSPPLSLEKGKTTKKDPRKPEALNPRHLKSSPATHQFRFKVLKMLHEQLVRLNNELKKDPPDRKPSLVLSDQELIWRALDEEEKVALDKPAIYANVVKNRIMALKRMNLAKYREERLAEMKSIAASHAAAAVNATAQSILGSPKVVETGLTPAQEVQFLHRILTPVGDLSRFNYVSSAPTEDEIQEARLAEEAAQGWEVCDRCTTRFQVFPERNEDGALASGGQCNFHPGKRYFPERQLGDRSPGGATRKRWRCCKEAVGDSSGCTRAATHVFKISHPKRLAAVLPFAATPPNPRAPADRAVCFDCEMGYTVKGLELIRLTATSWPDGAELLDVLVRPIGAILDLNSRYSGIWPEDLANAVPFRAQDGEKKDSEENEKEDGELDEQPTRTPGRKKMQIVPSPAAARDLLFSLISPESPLIGHGLENDLNAMRIVHPTLVDTVLLFPHRRGLPLRHGLKALMERLLNRAIQVEPADDGQRALGHDSAEDARAAGDLVRLKVQQEWSRLKGLGWTLEGGVFVPPSGERDEETAGSLTEEFLEKPLV